MKIDGRTISKDTREHLQKVAISRVQAGEHPEVVIESLGLSSSTIYLWLAKYRAGGWDALKDKKGVGGGRPQKLSPKQIKWIYSAITAGDPRAPTVAIATRLNRVR